MSFQIRPALEFIVQFLKDNPFVVCPDELSHVKKELSRGSDEVKVRQKAGTIVYKAMEGRCVCVCVCVCACVCVCVCVCVCMCVCVCVCCVYVYMWVHACL